MKRLLLTISLAIFISASYSQEIQFGVKGGINLASVGSDGDSDVNTITAFHVGGLMEIALSERFALQPELVYSGQGAKVNRSASREDVIINANAKIKLDYLNIPLLAKYYIFNGFSLEAGPQIGFLLRANTETDLQIQGDLPPELLEIVYAEFEAGSGDIKDRCETLDISLGAGLSYKLENNIFFGVRYNLGLTNIYKDDTRA
ncbi:PorT family protein [Aequorivita sp. H23M31]|uniref:PorT family protein n=1 Tax=Aequorivita ciconiae TaxID=2494375 RepID=A0A410FZZ9_9FLAO|nr:porin family protein [Aequorivita sp. H23M31]QAA80595.1 PorT family protein [Aequorivita sp. H23M31]